MTDANAVQTAADAWEHTEAPAAAADQKAVAAADDQSAHAQDAAAKTGGDAVAADAKTLRAAAPTLGGGTDLRLVGPLAAPG